MNRYFKIFLAEFNISLKKYMENRITSAGMIGANLLQLVLILVFVQIYFSFTNSLLGWDKYQVILLTGIYRISSSLFSFLFLRSLYYIPYYVKTGELDIYLTKPVNVQFFLSFRLIRVFELISAASGIAIVLYALPYLNSTFSLINWLALIIGLILGLIVMYGICLLLATLSIWMGRFDSLTDVYGIIDEPLHYPMDILGKQLVNIFTFVLPLALIVTLPVKLFLGKTDSGMYALGIFYPIVILAIASSFWNFSLKHYTSASS